MPSLRPWVWSWNWSPRDRRATAIGWARFTSPYPISRRSLRQRPTATPTRPSFSGIQASLARLARRRIYGVQTSSHFIQGRDALDDRREVIVLALVSAVVRDVPHLRAFVFHPHLQVRHR